MVKLIKKILLFFRLRKFKKEIKKTQKVIY